MNEEQRSRSAAAAALIVVAVALVHRTALFFAHRADLDAQVAANPTWYTFQNLPLPMLREHLGLSLLLLQQTPPIPNLVMGLVGRMVASAAGVTYALIALQAALSIATALVLQRLLLRCRPGAVLLATAVAIGFLLDTDVVVLEYNSLGQTFYESISMLLALTLALQLVRLRDTGNTRDAAWAGVLAAGLALTRATWSFIAAPATLLVALLAPRQRARAVVTFLVPVLVLHGGWAVKNAVLYGRLTPATSSWTGYNLYNGLRQAGFEEPFRRFVVARAEPAWFVEAVERRSLVPWPTTVPEAAQARDRAIAAWSGVENPPLNSTVVATVFREFEPAFAAFAWHRPDLVLEKMGMAYRLFWQPPATYGRMFLALFCIEENVPGGLDLRGLVDAIIAGRAPAQYVVAGKYAALSHRPTSLWTLRRLEPAWLLAMVLAVHVLVPVLVLVRLVRALRGDSGSPDAAEIALVVCWLLAMYVAVGSSVSEFGENMRFRIGVEPLFWVVTVLAWGQLGRLFVRRAPRSAAQEA